MNITEINIFHIIILNIIVWHYCLRCGYVSDDHATVEARKDIIPDEEKKDRGEKFWVKLFNDGPVLYYVTRIGWKLGFTNKPFFWHIQSLALHLVNVWLLYHFLVPIMGHSQAIVASAFWSINPMMNQNVAWISGRPYLFGFMFAMVAMICWQSPEVYLPFYALGLITNISIFFIPILTYFINQSWLYILIMICLGVPIIAWKFHNRFHGGLVLDRENFRFKPRKVNAFVRVVAYYIYCLIFPTKMGWYHQAGFRYNDKWEKFNYYTLISYWIFWALLVYAKLPGWIFVLGVIPVANIFATNSFVQDRYIYFCSIGIAMILAPLFVSYPGLFYMAIAFYGSRAYSYTRHLINDEKLYRENWRNHPRSDHAINNLSFFLIHQRRYDESQVVIEQGLDIDKTNKMLWYNLGITYAARGHFQNDEGKWKFLKAVECWKTALQIEPRWSKPAEDLKKIIKLLVDNKVLQLEKKEGAGVSISIPSLIGIKEMFGKEPDKEPT